MNKSISPKERWPVDAGLFVDITKMCFVTHEYCRIPIVTQFTVKFQQASSLNIKLNGVIHV